jgi:hypothetical protein
MTLPGNWFYRIATRNLDPVTIQNLIEPAIADLQYEVAEAGSQPRRRSLALCRGYMAVMYLVGYCLVRRLSMRRFLTVFLLGSTGGALAITRPSSMRGDPAMIVFLATAIMSVAVLRFMRLGPSYKQAFLNCMGVGIIMAFAFFGWTIVMTPSAHLPWYAYVLILSFLIACVSLGSALAAAVVWNPPIETQPIFRLRCIQILTGCTVFAGADILSVMLRHGGANLFRELSWAAFEILFFVAVSSIIYLPVLLAARRIIQYRLPIAMIGAIMFPIPLMGIPFLQGRGPWYARILLQLPVWEFIAMALPYLLCGVVLGWLLGKRHHEQAQAYS